MTGRFGKLEAFSALGLALVFWAGLSANMSAGSMYHDYLGRYTEGTLVWEGKAGSLYDVDAERAVQSKLGPKAKQFIPCTRPAFYAILMAPLAWVGLPTGYWIWVAVQGLLASVAWFWARREFGWGAASAVAVFLPLGQGILGGQDNGLVLALMLAAWVQVVRGKDGWAGSLVAMTLFKSHLLLLLPVAMAARRRWRMLGAWAATAAIEAGISVIVASPKSYIELLARKDLDRLSPASYSMPNVYALLENLGVLSALPGIALALAVAALALRAKPAQGLEANWFWAAAAGSILITPHTYYYDMSLLLPAILALAWRSENGLSRGAAAVALLPVVGFTALAPVMPSLVMLFLFAALAGYLPETAGFPGRAAEPGVPRTL